MVDKNEKVNLPDDDEIITPKRLPNFQRDVLDNEATQNQIRTLFNNKIDWSDEFAIRDIYMLLYKYLIHDDFLGMFANKKVFDAYFDYFEKPLLKTTKSDTTFFYTQSTIPKHLEKDYDINTLIYYIGRTLYLTKEVINIPIYENINKVIIIFNDCNPDQYSKDKKYKGMYGLYKDDEVPNSDGFAVIKIDNLEHEIFLDNYVAKPDQNELSSLYKKYYINNNNKNTALDNDQSTSNDLDTLEEQKDDPQRGRVGRDFKSASWTKQNKSKITPPHKEKQKRQSFRTFVPVLETIEECCADSNELFNEWIVRAIIDRIQADYPERYEELKARKDEFPPSRSDAKPGIDFLYEK
jgi:hypothetical protein